MKKNIIKVITIVILFLLIFATKFIYGEFFVPSKVMHVIERAYIVNMYTRFQTNFTTYHIVVDTCDTDRELDFIVPDYEYTSYEIGDNVKVGYDYNEFKHFDHTIDSMVISSN